MTHPFFPIRGVIEGFYGLFYTAPERNDLISFISEQGYNTYIYGPKNDRQHRARWREPYPEFIMEQFAETVEHCKEIGIDFCYSIGAGVSINYASEEDYRIITSKFKAFYDIGVRTFMIMLDDITPEFNYEAERKVFDSYGHAHVQLTNRLHHWLTSMDPTCRLSLCPTDYHGVAPFSEYIHELGNGLHPDIDVFYTGPEICSKTITERDSADFAKVIKRKPIIWDNYPVNDLAMTPEMHIGPISGRDSNLYKASKGIVVNTMNQAEASKIPLYTFADYMSDPESYDPWSSWEKAIKLVGGAENYDALMCFAENSLSSCLGHREAEPLERLTVDALKALESGGEASESKAVQRLYDYLDSMDEAGYKLKFRMENYALRNDLAPWIELMESWAWAGRRAISVLRALESNQDVRKPFHLLLESIREVENHPKRITGDTLRPLIEYTKAKVENETTRNDRQLTEEGMK